MATLKSKTDHLTLSNVLAEIQEQPAWRTNADREMDYCDGNQLDSNVLRELEAKGIPPAIENLMGPAMEDIAGMEAKNRTDWRVQPDADDDPEADAVAKAVNLKLNQAERRSGADRALTEMYGSLSKVGIGFVEVSRNPDPFAFPYRCDFFHRNEGWWDWFSKKADFSDARWFLRRRWVSLDSALSLFPKKKELIMGSGMGWGNIDDLSLLSTDSGASTDLRQSQDIERGWSVEEQEWRDPNGKRVCFFHLMTREPEQVFVLRLSNGRTVEFNADDPLHIMAASNGIRVEKATVGRIYNTIFLGPHTIEQNQSEFTRFNVVAAFGKREDRTRTPYGTARWLMYLQDEVNARVAKMQWLLGATRTTRTAGAVLMTDEILRQEVGRPDADIVLDQAHMALPGAMFEIDQNLELNRQQYERLLDLRESIKKISGVSAAFSGEAKPDNAGALSQMVEQSVQSLATLNDNFGYARQQVGELLLHLIVKDMGKEMQTVTLKGQGLKDDEVITLNAPATDEATGHQYLTNDVQRTMLKVVLEDVPSTPSFRQQQLSALSEAFKSAPPQYQAVMMPHLMHLANVPNKEEIIKAIVEINRAGNITEQQVEERIKQAVEKAKTEWMVELKGREIDIKERKTDAEIEKIVTEQVNNRIEAIYSAVQAAGQIVSMPAVVPVSDQVLKSAGGQDMDTAPIIAPPASTGLPAPAPAGVRENTSPMFPPRVQEPDMLQVEEPVMEDLGNGPDAGINEGIESEGIQG